MFYERLHNNNRVKNYKCIMQKYKKEITYTNISTITCVCFCIFNYKCLYVCELFRNFAYRKNKCMTQDLLHIILDRVKSQTVRICNQ